MVITEGERIKRRQAAKHN